MKKSLKSLLTALVVAAAIVAASLIAGCTVTGGKSHVWSDWEVVREAECEAEGEMERVCTECGETEFEIIPAQGHLQVGHEKIEPTCTGAGLSESLWCERCGAVLVEGELIEPLGHDEIVLPAQEPTCTIGGHGVGTACARCGEIVFEGEYIEALGHDPVVDEAEPATCVKPGKTEGTHCARCGNVIKPQRETEIIDHVNYNGKCTICEQDISTKELIFADGPGNDSCVVASIESTLPQHVIIPATHDGKKVVGIGSSAFSETNILSVDIADSVAEIESYAFYGCWNLKNVFIPEGVEIIGNYAFGSCNNLAYVSLPESLVSISRLAFDGSRGINLNQYGGFLYYLGNKANPYMVLLELRSSIEKANVHPDVKLLAADMVSNGSGFVSFNRYDNANYVGNEANPYMILVKAVNTDISSCKVHPDTVFIYENAFRNCRQLACINLPAGVNSIGNCAFENCVSLSEIVIPEKVKAIPSFTFNNSGLSLVDIRGGVRMIGNSAFFSCDRIESVHIPSSVISIGNEVFSYCRNLKEISVDDKNACYKSVDGNLYTKSGKTLLRYVAGKTDKTFVVPSDVTEIGNGAFNSCAALINISLHPGITKIGSGAFGSCTSLQNITIPVGVTEIGDSAFGCCTSLQSFTLPDGLRTVKSSMFYECTSLQKIIIPDSVTEIESCAFVRCKSLRKIDLSPDLTAINSQVFMECSSLQSVTIPAGVTKIDYFAFLGCEKLVEVINKSALPIKVGGNEYGNIEDNLLKIKTSGISDIVSVGDFSFLSADGKNYLVDYAGTDNILKLPESYAGQDYVINAYAFIKDKNIAVVEISDGVTEIKSFAFAGCTRLLGLTIGKNVAKIYDDAFSDCPKLSEIINNSNIVLTPYGSDNGGVAYNTLDIKTTEASAITKSGDYLFYVLGDKCYIADYLGRDANLVLPEQFRERDCDIFNYAFFGLDFIEEVTVSDKTEEIGSHAFEECTALSVFNMGKNVVSIGKKAFSKCTGLTKVYSYYMTKWFNIIFSDKEANPAYYAHDLYFGANVATVIYVPKDVDHIHQYAFAGCDKIKKVVMYSSVQWIGIGSFDGCNSIETVQYYGTEDEWQKVLVGDYNDVLKTAEKEFLQEE